MTLYSDEQVHFTNLDTGEQAQLNLQRDEESQLEAINEGRLLGQLKTHSGFEILEKYLQAAIEDIRTRLVRETDFKRIRRLQETATAYQNVLGFIDFKISEGQAFEKQRTPTE